MQACAVQVCVPAGILTKLTVASRSSQVTVKGSAVPSFSLVLSGEVPAVNIYGLQTQNLTILSAGYRVLA